MEKFDEVSHMRSADCMTWLHTLIALIVELAIIYGANILAANGQDDSIELFILRRMCDHAMMNKIINGMN